MVKAGLSYESEIVHDGLIIFCSESLPMTLRSARESRFKETSRRGRSRGVTLRFLAERRCQFRRQGAWWLQ